MKRAYSLFELSITVLIIAIIIAGVTQTTTILKKSYLATAQTLTKNSIVNHLDNLMLWYETSLDSSFLDSEIGDSNSISTWIDNNPNALTKNNATQNIAASKPQYLENIFNKTIPALRFAGDDLLVFDGTSLANNSYTIFVVEQRRSSASGNYFIGGLTLSSNQNLVLGYRDNVTITQSHYANDLDVTITGYSTPTPRIHSFVFDTTNGKNYWLNGALTNSAAAQTSALTSFSNAAVGRYNSSFYNGDLAEVIIFKSKLKSEDRRAVEIYLSKKYQISLS